MTSSTKVREHLPHYLPFQRYTTSLVDEGPFSAPHLEDEGAHGPLGLGTSLLTFVPGEEGQAQGAVAVLACVPDGVGEASRGHPFPGVPCEGARLYAVNL